MASNVQNVRPGDELYVRTQWSIDHGYDDMCGGIAVVDHVTHDARYGAGNDYFVYFVGLSHGSNLRLLLKAQDDLEAEYGDRLAHMCPEDQPCPGLRKFDPETFQFTGIKK